MKFAILFSSLLALGLSACATSSPYSDRGYARHGDSSYQNDDRGYAQRCNNCGFVERIERNGRGRTSGGGAVAGAIIGGAVGNQVGSGDGRKAATVAGAIIGGIAGNKVERDRSRRYDSYDILVDMDKGGSRWITQRELRGVREGSRVEVVRGHVYLRRR